MMRALAASALLLFTVSIPGLGDQVAVVLPVAASTPIPGATGSLWVTDVVVRNFGPSAIHFALPEGCGAPSCPEPFPPIPPNSTRHLTIDAPMGAMLMMSTSDQVYLAMNLRVRDLSRQSQTWGTEIPVFRQLDLSTVGMQLINIPVSADFRTTIRIYDLAGLAPRKFHIRVFSLDSDALLEERFVTTAHVPGQGMTAVAVGDAVPSTGAGAVRVEVAPFSEGSRFFAFATVTNNATQHVTVITQQP